MYGTCSQLCANTDGSFTCGCVEGYLLQPDNRSCKAKNGRWAELRPYGQAPSVWFPGGERPERCPDPPLLCLQSRLTGPRCC